MGVDGCGGEDEDDDGGVDEADRADGEEDGDCYADEGEGDEGDDGGDDYDGGGYDYEAGVVDDGGDYFFFQAEDGIRDSAVTGVQTCALPIWDGLVFNMLWQNIETPSL